MHFPNSQHDYEQESVGNTRHLAGIHPVVKVRATNTFKAILQPIKVDLVFLGITMIGKVIYSR